MFNALETMRRGVLPMALAALLMPLAMPVPPAAAQQAAVSVTAAAAPADTAIFISVDLDHESSQSLKAQELLDRLGLGASWDDWHRMAIDSMPSGTGITEQALAALLGGEGAIAISPAMIERAMTALEESGIADATPVAGIDDAQASQAFRDAFADGLGVVAILEPGDPDGAWSYVERQMAIAAEKAGGAVTTETYNGVDVLTAPDSSFYGTGGNQAGGEGAPGTGEIVTARVGDLILTATSTLDLQPSIDAASGGDSLAGSDAFNAVRDQLPDDALAIMFANARPITDAIDPKWLDLALAQYQGTASAEEARAAFGAVAGTAVWADDPGFRVDAIEMLPNGDPLPNVLGERLPNSFDQQVPAGTMLYAAGTMPRMSLDQMAYSIAMAVLSANGQAEMPQTMQDSIDQYAPEELARQLSEAQRFLGFNPKSDFTDRLTGSFGMAVGLPAITLTGLGIDAVMTAGLSDPATIATDMVKVARLAERTGQVDVSAAKIGTDTVYTVKPAKEGEGVPGMGFGVLGDNLVAGTTSGIAAWRLGPDAPLTDDPQYQQVMGLLPADPWMAVYVDFREIVPLIQQMSDMGGSTPTSLDADPACAAYPDAAAAQAAFEQEPLANSALDSDFDGQACEEFFGSAATPEADGASIENLRAYGMTAWQKDGRMGWSMLLHIAEAGS